MDPVRASSVQAAKDEEKSDCVPESDGLLDWLASPPLLPDKGDTVVGMVPRDTDALLAAAAASELPGAAEEP